MTRSKAFILITLLTSMLVLACSLLPLPGEPTGIPPTFTPPAVLQTDPPTETRPGLQNENLLAGVPPGFKIDYQAEQGNLVIHEMVPESESVDDWTSMVTVQIFLGETNTTSQQYQETMNRAWFAACEGSESYPVADGDENGYSFVLWQLYCPLNPATQKVEYAYMKAIQGNDSFYLVQVAFRYEPTQTDITEWMNYLREVQVCDSRVPERACP